MYLSAFFVNLVGYLHDDITVDMADRFLDHIRCDLAGA